MADPDVTTLLRFLDALDTAGAVEHARRVAAERGLDRAVTEVLAPVQDEIGRRWASGRWTVGQEHAATAIVDTALTVLDSRQPAPGAPHMAMVCAEGEWHATPPRMAAARFRARGWRVDLLGGSEPPRSLGATLDRIGPAVLAVSCTLPRNLLGARRTIAQAHDRGIPVLAGGAAIEDRDVRAAAIGADAWTSDLDAADATARGWLDEPPTLRRGVRHNVDEVTALGRQQPDIVASVYADLLVGMQGLDAATDHDLELIASDIRGFVVQLRAALDVDDPTVLQDLVGDPDDWGATRAEVRERTAASIASLARHLGDDLPTARRFLAALRLP